MMHSAEEAEVGGEFLSSAVLNSNSSNAQRLHILDISC